MDNDDQQIGRILSRREVLALFGMAGVTVLVGCGAIPETATTASSNAMMPALNQEAQTAVAMDSAPTAQAAQAAAGTTADVANGTTVPACVVRPEVTEGPYYVKEDLVRSDIREDRHCNAAGQYSDVSDPGFTTKGQTWLRGAQVTDANGKATFTTIYPGWYRGRAVHIHFKVHPDATKVFTSQLFFNDALSQQVFTQAPYASKGSTPDTLNSTDSIYQEQLLLTTTQTSDGYAASFNIGIDPTTVGTGQSGGPGGPPPRP